MTALLIRVVSLLVAIALAAYVVPGVHATLEGVAALALILTIFNTFLKPLIVLITLPITLLTLGLFALVINVGLTWLAIYIVPGVAVSGIVPVILFSLVVSVASALFSRFQ